MGVKLTKVVHCSCKACAALHISTGLISSLCLLTTVATNYKEILDKTDSMRRRSVTNHFVGFSHIQDQMCKTITNCEHFLMRQYAVQLQLSFKSIYANGGRTHNKLVLQLWLLILKTMLAFDTS